MLGREELIVSSICQEVPVNFFVYHVHVGAELIIY